MRECSNTDRRTLAKESHVSYQAIIFDLDGTLLNTLDDLHASTNYALAHHGMPPRTTSEVRQFVGNGIANLIRLAVPANTDDETIAAVHQTFDEHYAAHHLDKTAPYPGMIELVDMLKDQGMSCCVVSNKGDYAVQPLVRHFFGDRFDFACGEREREGIRRKPWPDTVLTCMQHVGCEAQECVYVGDSEVDLLTAANAGIECVTVAWGFRDEDMLVREGATTIVHTTDELKDALLRP